MRAVLAAVPLVLAAAVVLSPARSAHLRLTALGRPDAVALTGSAAPPGAAAARSARPPAQAGTPARGAFGAPAGSAAGGSASAPAAPRWPLGRCWSREPGWPVGRPRALAVVAAGAAAAIGAVLAGPVLGFVVGAYTAAGGWAWHRQRRSRADDRARAASADALVGFADDLRAGRSAIAALRALVADLSGTDAGRLTEVRGTLDTGGDVVTALRAVPGPLAPVFDRLAAVWALTESGAPLADVADRLDDELRSRRRAQARADAQSAAARTTARLVAGLPLLGLLLGQALGADPLRLLTQTAVGAACAVGAVLLHLAGFAWAGRIAAGGRRAR